MDTAPSSVWGNILHDVMEACLSEDRWDKTFINDEIDDASRRRLPDLMRIQMSVEEVAEKVKERAGGLEVFSKRYMGKTPKVWEASVPGFLWVLMDSPARRNHERRPSQGR